jgi:tetratricopeptide (TPR) repeat protein
MNEDLKNRYREIFLDSWHPFLWIASIIFLIYSATLFFGIVYLDDNVLVIEHYAFNKNIGNIPVAFGEDIFRTPHQGGTFYRPILRLTFMLDAQFGRGAIIFMSHLSNLLLHILAACLLFIMLIKLKIKKETALWFSVIFGIHPLTAQTVAFIAGRNDSLLAILIFPALWFLVDFLQTFRKKAFFWHLTFLTLALLTKETAVMMLFIGAIYIILFIEKKEIWNNYKQYLYLMTGWGSLLLSWLLIRKEVLNNFVGNANYNIPLSIYENFPSLLPALGKIFFPFDLSVFPVLQDMTLVYGIISLVLLLTWFIFSQNKNYRLIIFGLAWFGLFILLTLIKPVDTTPDFSENRIYLPMLGFIFILLGIGRIRFVNLLNKRTVLVWSLLMIIVFSSITIYRNKYYKNKLNFWRNAVATSPSFAFNYNNLGAMYYLDGSYDAAEKEFQKALNLNPREKMAHNNLGLVYLNRKEWEKAETEFKAELEINPNYDLAFFNSGLLYYQIGKKDEAESFWKKTLEINPNHPDAWRNLAVLFYERKDLTQATEFAKEAYLRGVQLPPELIRLLETPAPNMLLRKQK